MPTIEFRAVDKSYGAVKAVRGLSMDIADGEFMCLLGPSGCGKTTTLRMIAGLESLSGGEIQIGERVVDSVPKGAFVPPEKRNLGLVFQSYALWPHLTIERNTDFGLRLRKVPRAERERRVTRVLRTLGIEQYRDRYPSQLSGGQQQRVALARMLAVNPEILLLDEPLSNLDARLRLEMRAELKRLHQEFGTTIVFVTHDQWEAMTLATTIAVMHEGELQQIGTPNEVYDTPANRFVAEFVGSPPINVIELEAGPAGELAAPMRQFLSARGLDLDAVGSVGVRPEAIRFALDADEVPPEAYQGAATLSGVLPTGGSWILELACGADRLFMVTHEAPTASVGVKAWFWVRPAMLHVFDRDGRRARDVTQVPEAA